MAKRRYQHPVDDGVQEAQRAFQLASDALSKLESLNAGRIASALDCIAETDGKIVVFGLGKSGLVGAKIAATLASLGTPAINVHPTDALHGDIGLLAAADVALIISRSGETDEMLALLPIIRGIGARIISITAKPQSTLAKASAVCLLLPDVSEAGHLDMAPTTSAVSTLALGDALAVALCRLNGFTQADYAKLHPAGALGKRMTLLVSDLMATGDANPTVRPFDGLPEVITKLSEKALGGVSVIDEDNRLLGIITDGDLRRAIARGVDFVRAQAAEIMTKNPITVQATMPAYDALTLMENRPSQISVLSVIDGDRRCVGMLRLHDLVRAGL